MCCRKHLSMTHMGLLLPAALPQPSRVGWFWYLCTTNKEWATVTIINFYFISKCFFPWFITLEQLTLSSMIGKEMSMNASFTVEIYRRKKTSFSPQQMHSLACSKHRTFIAEEVWKDKEEVAISSEAQHLVLSTFKDTFFPITAAPPPHPQQLVLELVLEVLFCFFADLLLQLWLSNF